MDDSTRIQTYIYQSVRFGQRPQIWAPKFEYFLQFCFVQKWPEISILFSKHFQIKMSLRDSKKLTLPLFN